MKTDKIETTQKAKSLYYLFGTAVVFLMLCLVIMPVAAVPGAFSITSIEEGDVLIPGTGVIVRWSASDGADGYKISMRDLTTDTVLFSNYDRGTKRSYSLSASDLTPGHDYRIAVCAYSSSGDTWFERCFSVGDAPAINAVYATPNSGNAGSIFSFTVWANEFTYNVGIEIDGYPIGTSDEYIYIKGQNVFVIEHLVTSPGNNRVVTAYAYSYDGSEKLTEGTAQTKITVLESPPAGVPTISSPLENSIHGIGEDLMVTWKAPSTSPDSYTVYLNHGSDILYHTSVSSTSVTIPGEYITSYGSYSIDVYSVKSGYSEDNPGNVVITVESPQLPAGVPVLSSPSATGTYYINEDLTVSWSAPSTNPDSYCIWLYGGGMSGGVLFDDIDETSFTIPGDKLANAGSYSVYVYAEKEGYVKDDSGNVLFTVSERPSSAQDLVNHMLRLKGMTGEDLGYTDEWCAWFIGDSAAAVDLEDIIPKYAKTGPCITGIMKAGGTVVCFPYPGSNNVFKEDRVQEVLTFKDTVPTLLQESERLSFKPKVGDVIGVLWDNRIGDHTISHVEVVYAVEGNTIYTVSGNTGDGNGYQNRKVGTRTFDWTTGKGGGGTIVAYARPNYAAVTEESLPTLAKPTITVPSADIDIYPGQELKVSWTISGTAPTKYIVQVFREGDFVGSFETSDKTITIPSSCLNILGEYSIDIYPVRDGYDSNVWSSVYFSVVSPVGDLTINSPSLNASLPAGSDVTVSWSKSSSATGYLFSLRDLTTDEIVGRFNRTDVGNVLSYPIGVLTAGHEYRAAVGAYSPLSDYVHWTTTTFSVSTVSVPSVTPSISLKYADNYYVRSDAKIEGDAVREQALSAVMARYQGVVDTSKPVIYFIEGYGSSLKSTSLSTAMCVVVIDGEIVFVSTNSATLPDQPYHPVTNDGTDLPTVVDGAYSVTNTLHRDYPALHVTTPPVVRIHVADECTDKGKCGSTTSAGINIHKPSSTSIVSATKDWANSAGCLLVGMHDSGENIYYGGEKRFQASNKEYDRFASVLGFAKSTYSENGISYGKTKLGDLGKKTACSVVIDRQYGYKNNAEFKSYLDTKYKNNNEVISKIIGSEYDYSVNVPENKPVEEKPLIFAVSTVLDNADLTDDTPIVVFWDVSDGALGYTFSMRDLTLDKKWIDNVDTNGKCTYTLSVEMLAAGHEYRVAVCAYNDAGETWVEYAFSIPEDESEIIPSSFIISDVSSPISVDQPLEITWTESIGATGYRFTLMDISESNVIENTTVSNELRYIIQAGKLAYGHNYCVAVCAYNDAGETWAEMEFSISPEACVLSFDANGGSGSMSPITGSGGKSYVLPECTFTAPAGKEFKAWIIGSDEYTPGSYYTPTSSVTIKALWVNSISTPEVTGTPDTSWYDADSSQFVISTADELAGLAQLVNGGESFEGKIVSLDADIDLSEYPNWMPIGSYVDESSNKPFCGTFDGDEHTISNLEINSPESDYIGLFGYIAEDAVIEDVNLVDVVISGNNNLGGLVAFAQYSTIDGCSVSGTVSGDGSIIGGIVGYAYDYTILTDSSFTGSVSGNENIGSIIGKATMSEVDCLSADCLVSGKKYVGGLVGFMQYPTDNISKSSFTGTITAKKGSRGNIGGIIGCVDNTDYPLFDMDDCQVSDFSIVVESSSSSSEPVNVGGLVGNSVGSISIGDSSVVGSILLSPSSWNSDKTGGLVGNSNAVTISNSEFTGNITGGRDVGGLLGLTDGGEVIVTNSSVNGTLSGYYNIGGAAGSICWYTYDKTPSCYFMNCSTNVILTGKRIGGLIASADAVTEVTNCCASGTITSSESDSIDGGLIGSLGSNGRIISSEAHVDISATKTSGTVTGGLVGSTGHGTIVSDCVATGSVSGGGDIGGFVGKTGNGSQILNCSAEGDVSGTGASVGGFVGCTYAGTIERCFASGDVDGGSKERVGGFVGSHYSGVIRDCYATGSVSSSGSSVGGFAGEFSSGPGELINCYATGDVGSTHASAAVGGLAGYSDCTFGKPIVSNSVALNGKLTGKTGGQQARIFASLTGTDKLTNNYGLSSMVIKIGRDENTFTASVTNGNDVSPADAKTQAFYEDTLGWDFDTVWTMNSSLSEYPVFIWQSPDSVPELDISISADKQVIYFGNFTVGYMNPNLVHVTITNTGDTVVTLTVSLPEGKDYYSVGSSGSWTLNPDEEVILKFGLDEGIAAGEYSGTFVISTEEDSNVRIELPVSFVVTPSTPTPDKPAAPTLTEPESLPDDAEIKTNTVADTSAKTKAEVGYKISPSDVKEMKAPTITRGSLSVMLNDNVKVMKKLSDGSEVEVEAKVNEDGSISINDSLDGAESVTVNFIGRQFGDVTNDGKPDTLDAARVLQASVGLYDFSNADTFYGDVSGDGFANTLDAARILQYSVNLVDENYITKS